VATPSIYVGHPRASVIGTADYIVVDVLCRWLATEAPSDKHISAQDMREVLTRQIQSSCKEAAVEAVLKRKSGLSVHFVRRKLLEQFSCRFHSKIIYETGGKELITFIASRKLYICDAASS
jgi:hypothetical protein